MLNKSTVFITGCAGFIGYHLAHRLLSAGCAVTGIDNLNDYYDPKLKRDRLQLLARMRNFSFAAVEIQNRQLLTEAIFEHRPRIVVHLAAQPGVRYSLTNPNAYVDANIVGFANVIEACRQAEAEHLLYASSSSVYGLNGNLPFAENDPVNHPASLYAATKRANELMAHSYSHLYGLPTTGLRFFTVYGPWGRPDMSVYQFARAIVEGVPLQIYGDHPIRRDYTFIDDAVEAVSRLLWRKAEPDPAWNAAGTDPSAGSAPYRIYNIGNGKPIDLLHIVKLLESELKRKAVITRSQRQPGDIAETWANTDNLLNATGYAPSTPIEEGIRRFATWFREYHL